MPRGVAIDIVRRLRDAWTSLISVDLDDHDLLKVESLKETIHLINSVDLFLPSLQDALAIVPSNRPLQSLLALRKLAPEPRLIAIKCGADGVVGHVRGAGNCIHVPAVEVKVIDTTGAGDAFCGGTLAGFLLNQDPLEGLLCGLVSASFCIERFGFDGLLDATPDQALKRLEGLRSSVSFYPADPLENNQGPLAMFGVPETSAVSNRVR